MSKRKCEEKRIRRRRKCATTKRRHANYGFLRVVSVLLICSHEVVGVTNMQRLGLNQIFSPLGDSVTIQWNWGSASSCAANNEDAVRFNVSTYRDGALVKSEVVNQGRTCGDSTPVMHTITGLQALNEYSVTVTGRVGTEMNLTDGGSQSLSFAPKKEFHEES